VRDNRYYSNAGGGRHPEIILDVAVGCLFGQPKWLPLVIPDAPSACVIATTSTHMAAS